MDVWWSDSTGLQVATGIGVCLGIAAATVGWLVSEGARRALTAKLAWGLAFAGMSTCAAGLVGAALDQPAAVVWSLILPGGMTAIAGAWLRGLV